MPNLYEPRKWEVKLLMHGHSHYINPRIRYTIYKVYSRAVDDQPLRFEAEMAPEPMNNDTVNSTPSGEHLAVYSPHNDTQRNDTQRNDTQRNDTHEITAAAIRCMTKSWGD